MIPAFETLKATTHFPMFVFGDHASKFIPKPFKNLGLSGADLSRHIAWDIGTDTLVRALCAHFGCAGQVAKISRLVIDMNRDPKANGLIPQESDGTAIAGNQNLTRAQSDTRREAYYQPYHKALAQNLANLPAKTLILSMHSFTPQIRGDAPRQTDIGLLVKHDRATAKKFQSLMRGFDPSLNIDINKPYSAYDVNYTIDKHIVPRGFRHLVIEVRQDHIETEDTALDMAANMAVLLEALLALK